MFKSSLLSLTFFLKLFMELKCNEVTTVANLQQDQANFEKSLHEDNIRISRPKRPQRKWPMARENLPKIQTQQNETKIKPIPRPVRNHYRPYKNRRTNQRIRTQRIRFSIDPRIIDNKEEIQNLCNPSLEEIFAVTARKKPFLLKKFYEISCRNKNNEFLTARFFKEDENYFLPEFICWRLDILKGGNIEKIRGKYSQCGQGDKIKNDVGSISNNKPKSKRRNDYSITNQSDSNENQSRTEDAKILSGKSKQYTEIFVYNMNKNGILNRNRLDYQYF